MHNPQVIRVTMLAVFFACLFHVYPFETRASVPLLQTEGLMIEWAGEDDASPRIAQAAASQMSREAAESYDSVRGLIIVSSEHGLQFPLTERLTAELSVDRIGEVSFSWAGPGSCAWVEASNSVVCTGGLTGFRLSFRRQITVAPGQDSFTYAFQSSLGGITATVTWDFSFPASWRVLQVSPPPDASATGHLRWANRDASSFRVNATLQACGEGVLTGICSILPKNYGVCPVMDVGQRTVGNPVNPGVGNKVQAETDYVGTGPFPLAFQRYYNSLPTAYAALGTQWRHSYQRSVVRAPSGSSAQVVRADGKQFTFAAPSTGTVWIATPDVADRLEATSSPQGWKYTTAEADLVEMYDAQGRLVSIANRAGLAQTLAYDAQGRLATVHDPFGRVLTLAYDTQGRLASVADPTGTPIAYTYDGATNHLIDVTYQDDAKRTYLYENALVPHALTGIVDENDSRFATYGYDPAGRATLTEHAGGADRTALVYSSNGTTTVTDARGTARTYRFQTQHGMVKNTGISQPCAACGGASATTAYNANGFVAVRTDFNGRVTEYTHDARGLETRRIEARGTPDARTITTAWHPAFRLPTRLAEPLRLTTYVYHGDSGILCGASGALCRRTEQATTDPTGAQGFAATVTGTPRAWAYTYNSHGQLLRADGPRTDVTDSSVSTYDAEGNLATLTNALGHVTRMTRYNVHGQPLTIVDPNGLTTTLAYDPRQRLTSRRVGTEVTAYAYDPAGQLIRTTLPDGNVLTYSYDAAHRLTGVRDSLGNRIAYTLDAMGNRTKEEVFDPQGALARMRQQSYNSLNRLISARGVAIPATSYTYDAQGNLTRVLDPLSHATSYAYDALHRPVQATDAALGRTLTAYDGQDQVTQVTDPRILATSYTLTGLGDLTETRSQDTGSTVRTYDAAGNLKTVTDARSMAQSSIYDALGRVTSITNPLRTFRYDEGTGARGRLTTMTDPSGSTAWSYDPQGRVTRKTQAIGTVSLNVRYAYDARGRMATMTLPSGKVLAYTYDAAGRVLGITRDGAPLLTTLRYRPFGPSAGWTWGNGTPYARSFDSDGRMTSYPLGATVRTLRYDAASRITGFTHPNAAENQTFAYDVLDRLTQFSTATAVATYAYDQNGNRTSARLVAAGAATPTAYTYPAASNRLTGIAGASPKAFTYDAAGNTASVTGRSYAYDGRQRLIRVTAGAAPIHYALNGLGQRVRKLGTGVPTTLFVYDEGGHLLGEYTADGQPIQEIVWHGDMPVAVLRGTQIYFIYTDHLHTPRVITDASNTVVWRWAHEDPFGDNIAHEDPDGDGTPFVFNLRFPGQYFDKETGLHYNYFRDYDPSTGRYIQSDPIGLRGGLNTYLYVGANPVRFSDPSGLFVGNPAEWAVVSVVEEGISVATGIAGSIITGTVAGIAVVLYPTSVADATLEAELSSRPWRKRDRWRVYVKCNIEKEENCANCPPTIGGNAFGATFASAFASAQMDANCNLGHIGAKGCHPRHCQPVACIENGRRQPCPKSGR